MDNPATESTGSLDPNQAAALFSSMIDDSGNIVAQEPPKEEAAQPEAKVEEQKAEPEQPEVETQPEDDPIVTVKIDGKDVEVKLSELKNGYQRQADYTRKTMEVAEKRKEADSETIKAREERETYARGLQQAQALLQAQLQEQNQIDWQKLLSDDPVEYLKQQHLYQQRQAQLQQAHGEMQKIAAIHKAETEKAYADYLKQQEGELLAKLPEWKDESKAKAEREAITQFLMDNGYTSKEVTGISDHRAVVMARKAMLYDTMMQKAQAAAKKVENLPTKVQRSGDGDKPNLDKRTAAYQKLSKSGRVEDAAAIFADMLG